jgi:hypothetical protein
LGFSFADGAGFDPVDALTPLPLEVPASLFAAPVPLPSSRFPLPASPVPLVAEPRAALSVVEVGPVVAGAVSDVMAACVDEPDVLLFAADADFVSPLLQATAAVAMAIEKRIERFIFRGWYG